MINSAHIDKHIRNLLDAKVTAARRTVDDLIMRRMKNVINLTQANKEGLMDLVAKFEIEADELAIELRTAKDALAKLEASMEEVTERLAS